MLITSVLWGVRDISSEPQLARADCALTPNYLGINDYLATLTNEGPGLLQRLHYNLGRFSAVSIQHGVSIPFRQVLFYEVWNLGIQMKPVRRWQSNSGNVWADMTCLTQHWVQYQIKIVSGIKKNSTRYPDTLYFVTMNSSECLWTCGKIVQITTNSVRQMIPPLVNSADWIGHDYTRYIAKCSSLLSIFGTRFSFVRVLSILTIYAWLFH